MSGTFVGFKVRALTIRGTKVEEGRREGMIVRAREYPKSKYISRHDSSPEVLVAWVVARASRVRTTVHDTMTTTSTEIFGISVHTCQAIGQAFLSPASDQL